MTTPNLADGRPVSDARGVRTGDEGMRKLAAGVAHDFNNLLAIIIGEADLALMQDTLSPELRDSFSAIQKAGREATALTRQMLTFAKRQLIQPVVFDLSEIVRQASKTLRPLVGSETELVAHTSPDAWVCADRAQIEQVIRNLVLNARDAMPEGGKIILGSAQVLLDASARASMPNAAPGQYVLLSVRDTGSGMTEAVKARLFEPLFSAKASGNGTGLGLAACREIVTQSGGHIAIDSEIGDGTEVKVYLPLVPQRTQLVGTPEAARLNGVETILLAEDDESVRQIIARMLQGQGYVVLQASGGPEALRILTASALQIDLLMTSVVLARMGGRELVERARVVRPGLRVLFVSGHTNDTILHDQLMARDVALVEKPFTAQTLGQKVREVLDVPIAGDRD